MKYLLIKVGTFFRHSAITHLACGTVKPNFLRTRNPEVRGARFTAVAWNQTHDPPGSACHQRREEKSARSNFIF